MLLFHSHVFGTVLHTGDARLQRPQLLGAQEALREVWEAEGVEAGERRVDLLILDATFGREGQVGGGGRGTGGFWRRGRCGTKVLQERSHSKLAAQVNH